MATQEERERILSKYGKGKGAGEPPNLVGHMEKVRALCTTARLLCVGGTRAGVEKGSEISIFDLVAGKKLLAISTPAHVLGLAFLAGGTQIAAAGADGTLRVYGVEDGREARAAIKAHQGACTGVFGDGAGGGYTCGADGFLRGFGADGKQMAEHALSGEPLRALAVDSAGEYLAAGGDDGMVRLVVAKTGERREMPGHKGPVLSLAFTGDGRLVSGGEDGTVRVWYLVGAVDCETRGGDESGLAGGVLALLVPPAVEKGEGVSIERIFAAGNEGKIKVYSLGDRRKPRTLSAGSKAVHALAFAPPHSSAAKKAGIGSLFAGGDARTLWRFPLDLEGAPPGDDQADKITTYQHGLDALAAGLSGQRPAREVAIRALAALEEPEALELLLEALPADREPELRALIASELGQRRRKDARPKLRERLDDENAGVRRAAFAALRAIDGEDAVGPLRAALASKYADVRKDGLSALVPLRETLPLVPGLIAGKLTDGDEEVRVFALDQLCRLHPPGSAEPLRLAYERGPADVRIEVLVRAAEAGLTTGPDFATILSRALDDEDAEVRRVAFGAEVLLRQPLATALEAKDEDLRRAVQEISRRVAARTAPVPVAPAVGDGAGKQEGKGPKGPSEEQIAAARARLPGGGNAGAPLVEEDLAPLILVMACKNPHTALRGARGLARLGDTRALGALLQLSRETDGALRREAAIALKELHDPRAKKRLVWMLDDGDAAVRAAALDAYGELLGGETLGVAEAALRSAHEDIRVRGLDRLMKLGEKRRTSEAEALLENAIEDEAPKVRGEAFRTLFSWHEKDPQKALDRAGLARFPDLRARAVEELAVHGKEEWARERLYHLISDRDAVVAKAAYDAVLKLVGKKDAQAYLLAMASLHPGMRATGAKGAMEAGAEMAESVRTALMKLLIDEDLGARTAGLLALDKIDPKNTGPHHAALQGTFLDLRVQAAELLAPRHDERLIEPMEALLSDKELFKKIPLPILLPLRQRAASALATLGAPRTVKYLATELLKDEHAEVREQAARGLAMAARRADEGHLLDALSHADVWVRSWAADGLARLGDVRALPVLTGNLRHEHLPIRLGAILSFAALGPEGYGGMLQGLEDPSREVQEIIFAIVLCRDLLAFRKGLDPDLLTSALSSQRPEIRYAAARALELRTDPEAYLAYVVEVLLPPRPEKAADMKDWPAEESRGRMLLGLAEALAGDAPEGRYGAAQVLNLRRKPTEYFKAAVRFGKPRAADTHLVPDTTPRAPETTDTKPARGWLRRIFSGDGQKQEGHHEGGKDDYHVGDRSHLLRLAFGAYVGLLRQVAAGDEEGHRVRRDAVDRIVELGAVPEVGRGAAIPPVLRALDDPNHLVRKAAFAGLKRLFPEGADEPLAMALGSVAADVARAALDEFAARGESARPRIARALSSPLPEVRRYAFELLEKLSDKGSLEPLLWALGSEYADLRIGVIERLATQRDSRVTTALQRAMESDHDDLRLRAAELLAERKDDRAAPVLGAFLRSEERTQQDRAAEALQRLASTAAVRALAGRIEEVEGAAGVHEKNRLIEALGNTGNPDAIEPLLLRLEDESGEVRGAAFAAALDIADRAAPARPKLPRPIDEEIEQRERRDAALALRLLRAAVRAKDPEIRLLAAAELDAGGEAEAADLLLPLFADRDPRVRARAVGAYSVRVIKKGARVEPLEDIVRAGARDLLLPAAEAVASRGGVAALRPLLLLVRAGEGEERERALLALGSLGDPRGLDELLQVAAGGTEEAPVEGEMQAAATEGLGRLANRLKDPEARSRAIERVEEASVGAKDTAIQQAAVRGLRFLGGERARSRLEALLADSEVDERVRGTAARELGFLGDPEAEKALARALNDDDDDVRREARVALDRLFPQDRTRVEFLAVDSQQDDISEPAAAYLADEGDPALLVPRLATQNDALRALLRYGLLRRRAIPIAAFGKLLSSEDASARSEAGFMIGTRVASGGPDAGLSVADRRAQGEAVLKAERLTAERWAAQHGDKKEEEAKAWPLLLWSATLLGSAEVLPRARELLRAPQASPAAARREAARAIEKLAPKGGGADLTALLAAMKDPDVDVRTAAAKALSHLSPGDAAMQALKIDPFDPVAFASTVTGADGEVLATSSGRRLALPRMISRGEVASILALCREAGDEATRLDAVAALGRAGGDEAMTFLRGLAADKKSADQGLRKAAFRALKRAERKAQRDRKRPRAGGAGEAQV